MKFYVSGKFADFSKISEVINKVKSYGHEITYDWTTEEARSEKNLNIIASREINGVLESDILLVYLDDFEYPYRGTYTEMGVALGQNKKVVIYDEHLNKKDLSHLIFYNADNVELFDDVSNLFKYIKLLKYGSYEKNVKKRLISLTGPMSSGKDTVADLYINDTNSCKIAIAGPLKKICSDVFNLDESFFNDVSKKNELFDEPIILKIEHLLKINKLVEEYIEIPDKLNYCCSFYTDEHCISLLGRTLKSPRHILQFIGTEYIRNCIDSDFHIKAAFSDKNLDNLYDTYIVTDVRFLNEHEFLKEKFGSDFKSLYIHRDSAEEKLNLSEHPSELCVKDIRPFVHNVLYNNKTIEDLYYNFIELVD